MSRRLVNRSIDHVVLERGEVANSWRTQRWDSLRLLTPNWMTRLPGYAYRGDDPDGYLTASETAQLIADYAKEIAAPVRANTTVISVRPADGQGKPQGVGKRWRSWYVGDDGKPLTRRFRTEVEAEAWAQQGTRQGSHKHNGSARPWVSTPSAVSPSNGCSPRRTASRRRSPGIGPSSTPWCYTDGHHLR